MRFIGTWLSDSIRLGLGLMLALAAMQVPALTHAYTAALLQVADGTRRDIDQRKEIARQYYRWSDIVTDDAVVGALRPLEPANADGLTASIAQEEQLRQEHRRLMAMPELLRPLAAGRVLLTQAGAGMRPVLDTALATHVPQVVLTTAAAIYGMAGLMLGLLLAQLLLGLPRALWRPSAAIKEPRHPHLRA